MPARLLLLVIERLLRANRDACRPAFRAALGEADEVLKQAVESSLKFPYTTLILGADGKGH